METETISIRISKDLKEAMDKAKKEKGINWNKEIREFVMEKLGWPTDITEKLEELVNDAVESDSRIKRWMLYWYAQGFSSDSNLDDIMSEHIFATARNSDERKEAAKFFEKMKKAGIDRPSIYIKVSQKYSSVSEILKGILKDEGVIEKIKEEIKESIMKDEDISELSKILFLYGSDGVKLDTRTVEYLLKILYGEDKKIPMLKKILGSGVIMHKGIDYRRKDPYIIPEESVSVLKEVFRNELGENKKSIKESIKEVVKEHPLAREILLLIGEETEGIKPGYNATITGYTANYTYQDEKMKSIIENPEFTETMRELIKNEIALIGRDYEDPWYYRLFIPKPARFEFTDWWIEETSS